MPLFAVLMALLEHALSKRDDEQRLNLVRGPKTPRSSWRSTARFGTLDKGDATQLKQDCTKTKELATSSETFRRDICLKELAVDARKASAKASAMDKGSGRRTGSCSKPAAQLPKMGLLAGDMSQNDVKRMPPSAAVWQALQQQSWRLSVRSHSFFSFPWRASRCREAALIGLRRAWTMYATDQDFPDSWCTVRGMFVYGVPSFHVPRPKSQAVRRVVRESRLTPKGSGCTFAAL